MQSKKEEEKEVEGRRKEVRGKRRGRGVVLEAQSKAKKSSVE